MAHAPPDRIARWLAGLDAELVALILRMGARIYDITQGAAPEESEGTFFPTPDGFFVLDVVGLPRDEGAERPTSDEHDRAAVIIRLVDSLYRTDKDLARRLLVAAIGELDSELEETAYRWQRGRMEDLGFADYYEALEVYRELDLGERAHRRGEAGAAAGDGRRRGGKRRRPPRADGARAAPERRRRLAVRARRAEAGRPARRSRSCASRWSR